MRARVQQEDLVRVRARARVRVRVRVGDRVKVGVRARVGVGQEDRARRRGVDVFEEACSGLG